MQLQYLLTQFLHQNAHAPVMLGGYRDRITQTQLDELIKIMFQCIMIDFVGNEYNRFPAISNDPGNVIVTGYHTVAYIHDKCNDICLLYRK